MAVVLTSTTSPQAEMDRVVSSDNWREAPVVEDATRAPIPTPEPAPAKEPEPEEPEVETAEAEPAEPPKKEHKSGWQKRIDKLTAKNHQLETRLAEIEAAKAKEEKAPEGNREPKFADFGNDVDKYIAARDAWKDAEAARMSAQDRQKAVNDAYNKKASEALGKYDDWNEAVAGSDIAMPQAAIDAIKEADNGPDVAYYLAKHPEEAQTLSELSPMRAIQVIYRISDKLAGEKEAPAVVKPKTKAPAPITPVGTSSTRGTIPLDQMNMKEFMKVRNKQERENRR